MVPWTAMAGGGRIMAKAVLTTKINPTYDDLPEQRYHFPRMYLRQIEAALHDLIVYYEPRRSSDDPSSRAVRQLPDGEYDEILRVAFAPVLANARDRALTLASPIAGFEEPADFERPVVERVITRPFRDAAFSGSIKSAYRDTCAFTGLKI